MSKKLFGRRALSCLLSFAMVMTLSPVVAFAAEESTGKTSSSGAKETKGGADTYVWMNIPYSDFYAAEADNTEEVKVDATSSATAKAAKNEAGGLAAGSYYAEIDADGKATAEGVIYPVKVSGDGVLTDAKQVADANALRQSPSYSYCSYDGTPVSYKELKESGKEMSFGKATSTITSDDTGLKVEGEVFRTDDHHVDYLVEITDANKKLEGKTVSGVTIQTTDSTETTVYGLRHVANIWRVTSLGFNKAEPFEELVGKTINKITYYLQSGEIYSFTVNLSVPDIFKTKMTVEKAKATSGTTTFKYEPALSEAYKAKYTVTQGDMDVTSKYDFEITDNSTLKWNTDTVPAPGNYTLKATDTSNTYANAISASFELTTDLRPTKYNGSSSSPALVLNTEETGATKDDFELYLKNVTSVRVNDVSYVPSGKHGNIAKIIDGETGKIDISAKSGEETIFQKGNTYKVTVISAGFPELTFSMTLTSSPSGTGGSSGHSGTSNSTTTENEDGSKTTIVPERTTGTVTETTEYTDGSSRKVETSKDGSVTTTTTDAEGTTGTVKKDAGGAVTDVEAEISERSAENASAENKPVVLPIDAVAAGKDDLTSDVDIHVPQNVGKIKVEIPVSDPTSGTVAVIVHEDGTEEIIKTSFVTEGGIVLGVSGDVKVRVRDNSKEFVDTAGDWSGEAIDFVTARELLQGTGEATFSPSAQMTRAMLMVVLARLDGVNVETSGKNWYDEGLKWAVGQGLSDGSDPDGSITREQIATMLYRYAGRPVSTGDLSVYSDYGQISDYAKNAVGWAVETGLLVGSENSLNPGDGASRAELATILMRFCQEVA